MENKPDNKESTELVENLSRTNSLKDGQPVPIDNAVSFLHRSLNVPTSIRDILLLLVRLLVLFNNSSTSQ